MGLLLLAIGYILGLYFMESPVAGLFIALAIWLIMSLVGYYQGDSILLSLANARKIKKADHPRLYNIAEEMTIASGLPKIPDIYIIDDPALNAFATGRDPEKAAIAITTGLLSKLNRDELQGVIGHEIAHIKNKDVLLMAMTSVLLGTIVILSWYASRVMIFGGGSRRNSSSNSGGGGAIIMIVALLLMILAPIMAQLIYFAISRKREYLADASSALYTRYPEGLASALEKIGASTSQLKSANQATAPMYINNPFRKKGRAAADLSSTHPPLSERIRILRSMGGTLSFNEYNKAFSEVHRGGGSVIPGSALVGAQAVSARESSKDESFKEEVKDKIKRTRETNDMMWRLNDYGVINCDCGVKLKVPASYKGKMVRCPHCGATHKA